MSIAERFFNTTKPLYLCDGSAFVYRGFYAYSAMQRTDGFPTSAIYIVARIILKILRTEQPSHFAFILDGIRKSFRNELYPAYKQNRTKTPEQLIQQIQPIQDLLRAFGIPVIVAEGAEADDYIACLAHIYNNEGIVIVGVDKDLQQCLTSTTIMWDPASKDERIITLDSFTQQTGLLPSQWADFQAIIGDSSDNIPGVPGIGQKTAQKIFTQYKSVEAIRDNIEMLEEKIQKKLRPALEDIVVYRELTRLDIASCTNITKDELRCGLPTQEAIGLLEEYELYSLIKEVQKLLPSSTPKHSKASTPDTVATEATQAQGSLFMLPEQNNNIPVASNTMEEASFATGNDALVVCTSIEKLPLAMGKDIAVLVERHSCSIYVEGASYTVESTLYGLEQYIQTAGRCATTTCKELLSLFPGIYSARKESIVDTALIGYLLLPEERVYTAEALYAIWNHQLEVPAKSPLEFIASSITFFMQRIKMTGLELLYTNVEHPLTYLLVDMEKKGITIDTVQFANFLQDVQKELLVREERIYEYAGKQFNIRSSQQLGEVLYETLGLQQKSKTKTGQFSTSQENLEKLSGKHSIIREILEFRKLEKMRSTYLEPLPKLVDAEDRIHTTFNQFATATGRLSSSAPNLQNIPIRGMLGKRMRQCFCASPGTMLIAADYSQIELRVLAYLSKEPTLVDAFANNEDIHRRTASLLYDIPQEDITATQRQNAKTINFGLLYGMGAQKLARELNITQTEAKAFIERYFTKLGTVKEFYEHVVETTKEHGYITTIFGRRRLLPDIYSTNAQLFSQAKRQAINTYVQGASADIIKIAMVEIAKNPYYHEHNAKLILQVHDELILEAPEEHANAVGKEIAIQMSTIQWENISIPLVVDWNIAKTWGDAH